MKCSAMCFRQVINGRTHGIILSAQISSFFLKKQILQNFEVGDKSFLTYKPQEALFCSPPPPPKFLKISFFKNIRLTLLKVEPSFITGS